MCQYRNQTCNILGTVNDCNSSKDMPCPCKAGYTGDHCEKCNKGEGFTGFDGIDGQVDPESGVGITCKGKCYYYY